MNSDTPQAPWQTNLFLVVGVTLTVVMALLMSQLDRLQTRLVPTVPVVAQATEMVATPTPLSAIALATALPPSPTALFGEESEDEVTAVPTVVCGSPPTGWVAYIVQAGDTLFILSRHSGASIEEIIQVNCLDGYLVAGTQIYLPRALPSRDCGPPTWWVRYTVQAGDTMFSLARSRGTTVSAVMNANCLTSTKLYAGRNIYLPPLETLPSATPLPQPTRKPQPTNTPVPTSSAPPLPSPTTTPTETGTAVTVIATNTATFTATATQTVTPTLTATTTATVVGTPTPSNTPTTITPVGTTPPPDTATPTGTATNTPTPTYTPITPDPYPVPTTDTPSPYP